MDLLGTTVATVTGSTISNNSARYGAGAYVRTGATLNLTDSTIASNTASDSNGAGINNDASTVTLTRSYLKGNQTGEHGGGLYNAGVGASATLTAIGSTHSARAEASSGTGMRS